MVVKEGWKFSEKTTGGTTRRDDQTEFREDQVNMNISAHKNMGISETWIININN